ncbi:MAG: GyrI-like domain-containing protein [Bacteroidales bacterium]|nr:GyrI-like domain-containing protein [Bacteroidales bacterium]
MKKISIILSAIIALLLVLYWYIGGFESMNVKKQLYGGFIIAGLEFKGPYHLVTASMEQADSIARSLGVNSTRGFGVYYDNPETTPDTALRSFVGNIIEKDDYSKIEALKKAGLRIDSVPEVSSLVIEMKIRTKFAYMIGPMKAYPKLQKAIQDNSCIPQLTIEVYDIPAKRTYYVMQCK